MNKKIILVTVIALVLGFGTGTVIGNVQQKPVQAATTAPDVQGGCPDPTSQGAYNQLGTDPTTGKAICHFVYSNACPYTEAVSADDPMCYKNQPAQSTSTDTTNNGSITPTAATTTKSSSCAQ